MEFLIIKWIHIVSSTLLFGTGLGSAFYKYMADKSCNTHTIAHTNKYVVLADWLFTTPTIIIQPITGILMAATLGYSLTEPWILLSILLYLLAGACWLPVVWLQIKMRNLSNQALKNKTKLPPLYWKQAIIWFWLGVPAFISMVGVFYLMTNKPSLF